MSSAVPKSSPKTSKVNKINGYFRMVRQITHSVTCLWFFEIADILLTLKQVFTDATTNFPL